MHEEITVQPIVQTPSPIECEIPQKKHFHRAVQPTETKKKIQKIDQTKNEPPTVIYRRRNKISVIQPQGIDLQDQKIKEETPQCTESTCPEVKEQRDKKLPRRWSQQWINGVIQPLRE